MLLVHHKIDVFGKNAKQAPLYCSYSLFTIEFARALLYLYTANAIEIIYFSKSNSMKMICITSKTNLLTMMFDFSL